MSTIKVVMQTEFSEQMNDAVKKNEMLQDEAVRAQVQIHNVSARAEAHLQKIQAELQAHRDEHRQTQQESTTLCFLKGLAWNIVWLVCRMTLLYYGTVCSRRI